MNITEGFEAIARGLVNKLLIDPVAMLASNAFGLLMSSESRVREREMKLNLSER